MKSTSEKKEIIEQADKENFDKLEKEVREQLEQNPNLEKMQGQVQFVREKEGLRIEIIDKADFSMFDSGTTQLSPEATDLVRKVGASLKGIPNEIAVRGHTDNQQFAGGGNNNWSLSANRADSTRKFLNSIGVDESRFSRIEGVADSQPANPDNPADPRNRRISITVLYRDPGKGAKN